MQARVPHLLLFQILQRLLTGGIIGVALPPSRLEKRKMGLTDVYVTVSNPDDSSRAIELEFLVDSGAIFSVVPRQILSDLGIVPDGIEYFKLADLTRIQREV